MPKKKTAQRKLGKKGTSVKQNSAPNQRQKIRVIYDGMGDLIDSLPMRNKTGDADKVTMDFDPIEIRGENLSTTIARERR